MYSLQEPIILKILLESGGILAALFLWVWVVASLPPDLDHSILWVGYIKYDDDDADWWNANSLNKIKNQFTQKPN